ncbi:MAG: hypothetical protein LAQ30_22455, partial [Acidobacteriia bacterium]|nr:hypothetical protein [Terriglobia bacterium]
MHNFVKNMIGMAAAAAVGYVLLLGTPEQGRAQSQAAQPAAQAGQPAAQPEKKPKDTIEYDLINEVIKDLAVPNSQKAITDLNTWTQKYPESDFKDDRLFYYQQAYSKMKPPDSEKVLDYGGQLMAKDLKTAFKDPASILQILYNTATAVQAIPSPTPQQLATAEKAANELQAFIPTYFTPANKPAQVTDAQWTQARTQLDEAAKASMIYVAMLPGSQAEAKKDWPAAEQGYRQALQQHPDNGWIAYKLGAAIMNEKNPDKFSAALFYIARGDAMDPAKGGIADPNVRSTVDAYLKKVYTSYHGSDEGLDQLKQTALASTAPPPDFKIRTATEIAAQKEEEFAKQYPELALWMRIKGALSAPNGEQYFQESMKEVEVKGLKGKIVGGKPECRSKELLVAVPEPNQQSTLTPEIALRLDTPLKGKPAPGEEVKFDGVPTAFSREPFMLTMDVEQAKVEGLKTETCTVAPAKKAPV